MAKRGGDDSLNVRHEQGPPPRRMATPMTTGMSPLQNHTLGDVLNLTDPADTIGILPGPRKSKRK